MLTAVSETFVYFRSVWMSVTETNDFQNSPWPVLCLWNILTHLLEIRRFYSPMSFPFFVLCCLLFIFVTDISGSFWKRTVPSAAAFSRTQSTINTYQRTTQDILNPTVNRPKGPSMKASMFTGESYEIKEKTLEFFLLHSNFRYILQSKDCSSLLSLSICPRGIWRNEQSTV